MNAPLSRHWSLDPSVDYLNHGSFGACPRAVLERQADLRAELEAEPVRFMSSLGARADAALATLGAFVGASPEDLAWVTNATSGVNAVLRSLRFAPGDELLVTDHAYNACRNALDWVAAEQGATVVVASLPFPLSDPAQITTAITAAVTDRTRLALIDHITSPTALVLPLADIADALHARGVDLLVDGAHAPGMIELDLDALGVSYYTGNCHKWLCAPKGVGFLHVRRDRQDGIVPNVISHGANAPTGDRSRFRLLFDWVGTDDPTPQLCVPTAIETVGGLVPGGWDEVRARNHALCLDGRDLLCDALSIEPPAPASMIGSIASIPIGDSSGPRSPTGIDPLMDRLFDEHRIEVPVFQFHPPQRLLRISAQLYNSIEQIQRLADVLKTTLSLP